MTSDTQKLIEEAKAMRDRINNSLDKWGPAAMHSESGAGLLKLIDALEASDKEMNKWWELFNSEQGNSSGLTEERDAALKQVEELKVKIGAREMMIREYFPERSTLQ